MNPKTIPTCWYESKGCPSFISAYSTLHTHRSYQPHAPHPANASHPSPNYATMVVSLVFCQVSRSALKTALAPKHVILVMGLVSSAAWMVMVPLQSPSPVSHPTHCIAQGGL